MPRTPSNNTALQGRNASDVDYLVIQTFASKGDFITISRIYTGRCRRGSNGQPCLAGAKPSVDPSKGVAAEGSARRRATASRQPNARPRDVASTTTGSAMAAALELLLTCISKKTDLT
jgi:hypothetical protein